MMWRLCKHVGGVALVAALMMAGRVVAQEPETNAGPESKDEMSERAKTGTTKEDTATVFHPVQSSPNETRQFIRDFVSDENELWTSPKNLRLEDTVWPFPIGGAAAGLFVTDAGVSRHLSHDPKTLSHFNTLSDAGVAALVGGAGGMWLLSHYNHNDHWRETGFLAGEAAVHSLIMTEAFKYSFRRERPYQSNGSGQFFQSGGTSFPSEHAAAAWSVAAVVAHEYPGPLSKILAYSAASLVSYSRVRAQKHFPSDVFVGALVGNMVAQNIYNRHHDPELGGESWPSLSALTRHDPAATPSNQGSPYVPLDSWIYPAFERLQALGAIDSGFLGMRPWTRNECVRLLGEADEEGITNPQARDIFALLEAEFRGDMERNGRGGPVHSEIESIYSQVTGISGQPLTDGNHFGQTLTNDFGRPYQSGFNSVQGLSVWTTSGHWVGYLRAEYQHTPPAPAQPLAAREFINSVDNIPGVPPATPYPEINHVQVLDAYVGLNFQNWQVTFGRQSLWWGPNKGGPLMFSDNAVPLNLFRVNRVSPFKLRWIPGQLLGPMRFEWFLGQQAGHQFVYRTDTGIVGQFGQPIGRQPFIQGQKLSFKPTKDFEFSVSFTVLFSGGPTPLTWHYLFKSYSPGVNTGQGALTDPGDARSGVDFSYRVPGLRKWLTFYGDAFNEDEISPLGYPRKAAYQGGVYMPRIPGIPKLDLRLEGGSTVPADFPGCYGCFYVNNRYPDGAYTNDGNLMGSWLGRAGQGEQAWSTYWLSSRNKIQFYYRHESVSTKYLPSGGSLNDAGLAANLWLGNEVMLTGSVQYERWNFPVLALGPQSDVSTSVGVNFYPRHWSFSAK